MFFHFKNINPASTRGRFNRYLWVENMLLGLLLLDQVRPRRCCVVLSAASICGSLPSRLMQQVSAAIQLLSRGQKSAVNCAQSSYSGWVTNWSRQHGGFGDLLSSLGITGERYTGWSHNKLTRPPPSSPQPSVHPLAGAQTPSEQRGEQLVKGDFSSSVYFPLVNCVIAHGSGAVTAQARPANELTSFKLVQEQPKLPCRHGEASGSNPFRLTIICFAWIYCKRCLPF